MRRLGLLLVVAFLLATGCGARPAEKVALPADLPGNVAVASALLAPPGGVPRAGEAAPDFSYTGQDGAVHRLSDLRGQTVLVNFWATWCAPCKAEMPDLQRLADERGGQVAVIGVNKLETLEAIGPFAREMSVRFPLVPDQAGAISDRYGAKNLPITYFVDGDGTVAFVQLGVMSYEQATERIAQMR